MSTQLIISKAACDTRAALVEDGRLAEFFLQRHADQDPTGNIYKGRVLKVLPGIAAAFVDIGLERPAYLYVEEVSDTWDELYSLWLKNETPEGSQPGGREHSPPSIADLLLPGQEVLVQVHRPPQGGKGARLTTHVTLAGHYLVYTPTLATLGVSKRVADEAERERLKTLLTELKPERGGLIARTASQTQNRDSLARERDALLAVWQKVLHKSETSHAPALLHQELDFPLRLVRDLFGPNTNLVAVDDPDLCQAVQNFLAGLHPWLKARVECYSGTESIFSHYGLDVDWRRLLAPQVWLKSGGYLVIDTTEALTAIDVNTGRFTGKNHLEETVLKTNLEAAREAARQVRLRNLGGLIVIDFIDMEKAAHRDLVFDAMVEELKKDRAKTTALPISSLGLMEMTRQRLRDSLVQLTANVCPCCQGLGVTLSPLVLAHDILRQLTADAREFSGCRFTIQTHPEVASCLRAEGQEVITRLHDAFQAEVQILEEEGLPRGHYQLTRDWRGLKDR
jgi:ribonuclease G